MHTVSHSVLPAAFLAAALARAQDLAPRAYLITPIGSNAVTISSIWNSGKLLFDPSIPVTDGKADFQMHILNVYRSYGLFGRSSNIVVSLPYAVGNFEGMVDSTHLQAYRSGLADVRVRFAINLKGGVAMQLDQFRKWREKTLIGASLTAVIPSGQNDPSRAVNIGTHRWALKPEIGFSRRRGKLVGEAYGGLWLFTANSQYFPGDSVRTQRPMGAAEAHLGYYVRPGLWASLDVNFWSGGRTTVNGAAKQDMQRNSRGGVTVSIPIHRHQSVKFSYSRGTYVTVGGDFRSLSAAWQYSWLSKAK